MPFSSADPYYTHGPAGWARQRVEQCGLHVEIDHDLEFPGYGTPDASAVIVRPGLAFPTFHWLLACGVVAHLFGVETAPDLPIFRSEQIRLDAQVIPLQRPGFTSGRWRR